MHILFATAEISPFTPSSDIAETCAKLAFSLKNYRPPLKEHQDEAPESPLSSISVVTPLYGFLDKDAMRLARRLTPLVIQRGSGQTEVTIYEGRTDDGVRIFFLEHEVFDGDSVYAEDDADNAERFGFFSRAVVEFSRVVSFPVDVIHCLGWQTGLIPVHLDALYAEDDALAELLTVFSIQNLGEQGSFDKKAWKRLDLPKAYRSKEGIGHGSGLNFMKGGIVFSDFVTAASPSYAKEITKKGRGHGLERFLKERVNELFGLIDGIDTEAWDPRTDPHLPINYDFGSLNAKRRNKAELQHIFDLPRRPLIPMVGILGGDRNLDAFEVMEDTLYALWDEGVDIQLVVLGEYDAEITALLAKFQEENPQRVGLHLEEDDALRHRTVAGIDALLIPATIGFDAVQLHAMRYGTVPVIPDNGGLRDTISEWDGQDKPPKSGVGMLFEVGDVDSLADTLADLVELYHKPRQWRPILERCMQMDYSWKSAAGRYCDLYTDLVFPDEE